MTEEQVKIVQLRRDEIREHQLRLQMELDGLTRCSPTLDAVSSDESANRKEVDEGSDSLSDVEDICKESNNKSKLFLPSKRMSSNGDIQTSKKAKICLNESSNRKEADDRSDSISDVEDICKESNDKSKLFVPSKRMTSNADIQKCKKAKRCLNDTENNDDFHYSLGSKSSEKTTSASIESIHKQLTVLTKRMDRIEKQLELKSGIKPSTSKSLPEVKNITSKSIFIGLRDVWIPDILTKIDELKGDKSALTEPKQ